MGSLAPLLVIFLKFALFEWAGQSDFADQNLLSLWETSRLSAVELLAPCVLPMFVTVMVTAYVFEFAVVKACMYDIGNELDEHGLSPDAITELREVFQEIHDKVTDESGNPLAHFKNVP